jgi:hypothetical protein
MQYQGEDRAISQVITDRCEELLEVNLANISGQTVALVDIMSLGDDWVSNARFTNVCQVVIEHAQGNQSPPDRSLGAPKTLLPSDELIHIVHRDGLRGLSLCPFEKDAYIAGIMECSTGARLPPSPVLLEIIDLLLGIHFSPP